MKPERFAFILFVLLTIAVSGGSFHTLAQSHFLNTGMPVLWVYSPREFKAHNQNWAITKDYRGVLYFGNSNGLLE